MSSKTATVSVPQKDGEITIMRGGTMTVHKVSDGTVKVEQADLAHFLAHVEGSEEQQGSKSKD